MIYRKYDNEKTWMCRFAQMKAIRGSVRYVPMLFVYIDRRRSLDPFLDLLLFTLIKQRKVWIQWCIWNCRSGRLACTSCKTPHGSGAVVFPNKQYYNIYQLQTFFGTKRHDTFPQLIYLRTERHDMSYFLIFIFSNSRHDMHQLQSSFRTQDSVPVIFRKEKDEVDQMVLFHSMSVFTSKQNMDHIVVIIPNRRIWLNKSDV